MTFLRFFSFRVLCFAFVYCLLTSLNFQRLGSCDLEALYKCVYYCFIYLFIVIIIMYHAPHVNVINQRK